MGKPRWNTAHFSIIGKRDVNDDAVVVGRTRADKRGYSIIIAADGVGSVKGSGALSEVAAQVGLFSVESFLRLRNSKRELHAGDADSLISFLSNDLAKINLDARLASTFVGAILGRRSVLVVWAGDSRAYALLKNGSLLPLTKDHAQPDGAICSFVRGDGCVEGALEAAVFPAEEIQLLAVMTDGVYGACSASELHSFFLYVASCAGIDNEQLQSDFVDFVGSNISDNATMAMLQSRVHMTRIQKAAFYHQVAGK